MSSSLLLSTTTAYPEILMALGRLRPRSTFICPYALNRSPSVLRWLVLLRMWCKTTGSIILKIPISSPAAVSSEAGKEKFPGHGVPIHIDGHAGLGLEAFS